MAQKWSFFSFISCTPMTQMPHVPTPPPLPTSPFIRSPQSFEPHKQIKESYFHFFFCQNHNFFTVIFVNYWYIVTGEEEMLKDRQKENKRSLIQRRQFQLSVMKQILSFK